MKRLDIKNWDTSDNIMKWGYCNGLRIVMPRYDNGRFGGGYQYRFCLLYTSDAADDIL
jgi:hypothetical protein